VKAVQEDIAELVIPALKKDSIIKSGK